MTDNELRNVDQDSFIFKLQTKATAAGQGIGNGSAQEITVPSSTHLSLMNNGDNELTITVGSLSVKVAAGIPFSYGFNAFTLFTVTAVSSDVYDYITGN